MHAQTQAQAHTSCLATAHKPLFVCDRVCAFFLPKDLDSFLSQHPSASHAACSQKWHNPPPPTRDHLCQLSCTVIILEAYGEAWVFSPFPYNSLRCQQCSYRFGVKRELLKHECYLSVESLVHLLNSWFWIYHDSSVEVLPISLGLVVFSFYILSGTFYSEKSCLCSQVDKQCWHRF